MIRMSFENAQTRLASELRSEARSVAEVWNEVPPWLKLDLSEEGAFERHRLAPVEGGSAESPLAGRRSTSASGATLPRSETLLGPSWVAANHRSAGAEARGDGPCGTCPDFWRRDAGGDRFITLPARIRHDTERHTVVGRT